jgi:hypothetical protein
VGQSREPEKPENRNLYLIKRKMVKIVKKRSVDKTTKKQEGGITGKGFKPGQSGNPAGRPKGSISLTSMIKKRLRELTPDGKRAAIEMLADNIIQDALDSSDNMRKLIWNYVDGLPKNDPEGNLPATIIINVISEEVKKAKERIKKKND